MLEQDRIIKINIEEEMKSSYIDYSMSVIVARALPDVRDGFKPVHRRILYGMIELGNTSDKAYKKSARIVGEVLGKYHPHGDSSVYGALVRMAQDWAMRYPLVDGQGNFGSVDGDSPAAMRYTEARLKKIGEEMMQDLYKETVDFQNNFDDTLQEPTVMPTRIPNLLVNGASGIAVGMATNMPTHNLSEVIDACIAYIDNNDIDIEGLMQYVKAPDFPTGGYIYGISGVRDAYETGRGRVVMRAKAEIETHTTHDKIIVNEIPYNVNKKELIENIASLVNDKKIDGISYVNDESDREGMRIVIDVKRDANASVVLNKLFKMTALQTSFGVNNIALVHGRPKMLNLKDLIRYFVEHRHDVVIRRTQYDLRKAQERAHILEGLIIASDNIDEVIRIIRAAKTPNDAIAGLIERFNLSEIQARAIVEMRLRQLTGLMQDQLHAEYEEVMKQIAYYEEILSNDELCKKVIKDELVEVKEKYGDARRSEIVYSSEEFNPEDFYADDQMVITISHMGYIKRTPLSEFRAQNRGGVGALVGGIVSGVIETGSQMVGAIQNGEKIDIDWGKVGLEAAKGVVKGAIAGTGAGLLVTAASNGLIDSTANAIEQKFIEGKQNIDVGEVVETGVWSAGTTLVFGGLDKAVDKVKSGIGWDKAVKQLRDEKGISAWMEKRRISTEKIKLREKRSLSDIIHRRNQPHKKEYTKILNDLNVRVGVLKSKTKWDRISGNVCRSARKRATEHLGRKEALKYMIINYSGQKLVGGVKDKIKNSIRNNLYLSNLKDAVDIDGHVNQFICAFT